MMSYCLIADLADILAKPERVAQIIKEELDEVKRSLVIHVVLS